MATAASLAPERKWKKGQQNKQPRRCHLTTTTTTHCRLHQKDWTRAKYTHTHHHPLHSYFSPLHCSLSVVYYLYIIYSINKFLLFISLLQITLKELMTRSRNEQEKYLWSLNLPRYRAYFLLPPRSDWSSPLATACACSANGAGRVRHSWPITASSGRMRQKTVTR